MGVSPSALGAVVDRFEENFREHGERGAAVSIWWRGEEVLSLSDGEAAEGRPWREDTLAPVYSATKVPAAATLLVALERHGLDVETPVREVWAAFPLEDASFGDLLSHQCGLAVLDQPASIWKHDEVVAAIERQEPMWSPGGGHGYHPRTYGALADEPVRRLAGKPLGQCWREWIAGPLDLDFWIGLPESEWPRVATLVPGRASPGEFRSGFYREFNRGDSITRRAFMSPRGMHAVKEMNSPEAWSAGFPAMGGVGSARGLARFYQAVIGAIPGPLSVEIRHALSRPRVAGDDLVLHQPTCFSAGCQFDPLEPDGSKSRFLYGPSPEAFGHPGAGGSHAFGDPTAGLSFAYVMNQMELSVMPGLRCRRLVEALFS